MNEELDAASLKEEAAVMLQLAKSFDGGQFCVSKCMRRASIDEKQFGRPYIQTMHCILQTRKRTLGKHFLVNARSSVSLRLDQQLLRLLTFSMTADAVVGHFR